MKNYNKVYSLNALLKFNTKNPGILLIKLFLARNTSASGLFPPHYERKIPGNPDIQEVFPARQSWISNISGFPANDDPSLINIFKCGVISRT